MDNRPRARAAVPRRPGPPPVLEVEELRTSFALRTGATRAVDGVSFSLSSGRTLGIVGESGSGKTVLSRSVMGLLSGPNVATGGSVRYRGQELVGAPRRALRALWGVEMAMVFQDPMTALNPVLKVGRNLVESLRHHLGLARSAAEGRAVELLRSVGIPQPELRVTQYPHQLSGGMRQRVTIALALACDPSLLFADEPTTALDVTVQAQILELLGEQQRSRQMAMVLVTHDLGVAAGRTDEIAVMYAGQIVEKAPTATLFAEMRMPYTRALLGSVPTLDQPSHTRLRAIHGRPPDLARLPDGCRFAPRCPDVQARCRAEAPPLVEAEAAGHLYRCWYPIDRGRATSPALPVPAPRRRGPEQ